MTTLDKHLNIREDVHVNGGQVDLHLGRVGRTRGRPALLIPGLASTPLLFGVQPRYALTRALSDAGYTPWIADFSLHWRKPRQNWTALLTALELGLSVLRRKGGGEPVALGHSMGGLLALSLACEGVPLPAIVTLGSAVDLRPGTPWYKRSVRLANSARAPLQWTVRQRGLPLTRLVRRLQPLAGRVRILRGQFHPGTTDAEPLRRMMRAGIRDVPMPLLMDLAGLFGPAGLPVRSDDGPRLEQAIRGLEQRVLLVAGSHDKQVTPEAVLDTAARMPHAEVLEVGDKTEGYGHLDLLTAPSAPEKVFEPVVRYLRRTAPASP